MLSSVCYFHINFSLSRDADRSINFAHYEMLVLNFFECEATRYIKCFISNLVKHPEASTVYATINNTPVFHEFGFPKHQKTCG